MLLSRGPSAHGSQYAMTHADRSLRCFAARDCRGVRRMHPSPLPSDCEQAPIGCHQVRLRMAHCFAQIRRTKYGSFDPYLKRLCLISHMSFIPELSFVYTTSATAENQELSDDPKISELSDAQKLSDTIIVSRLL